MALMGSNLCVDNLDVIATMNRIANDGRGGYLGLRAAIGVAMEAGIGGHDPNSKTKTNWVMSPVSYQRIRYAIPTQTQFR